MKVSLANEGVALLNDVKYLLNEVKYRLNEVGISPEVAAPIAIVVVIIICVLWVKSGSVFSGDDE
jgi:hypothetical protein